VSAVTPTVSIPAVPGTSGSDGTDSLWKNYRTSERKGRRSINRTSSGVSSNISTDTKEAASATPSKEDAPTPKAGKTPDETGDAMDVDGDGSAVSSLNPGDKGTNDNLMQVDDADDNNAFNISSSRGYDLLSGREVDLCVDLKIYPAQYLEIKKALIQESLRKGLLQSEGPGSSRRIVVKMDVKRRGDVVDFLLRAGWISPKLANLARTVTPPPATPRSERMLADDVA
jgi:hypothetical protein